MIKGFLFNWIYVDSAGISISHSIQLSVPVDTVPAIAQLTWLQGAFIGTDKTFYPSWSLRIKQGFPGPPIIICHGRLLSRYSGQDLSAGST